MDNHGPTEHCLIPFCEKSLLLLYFQLPRLKHLLYLPLFSPFFKGWKNSGIDFFKFFYGKQMGYMLFLFVHEVKAYHLCNHTFTKGNVVWLILLFFTSPKPYHPSFPFIQSLLLPVLPSSNLQLCVIISRIICPLIFWDWLISLSMIFSNFIHLPEMP